MPSHNKHLQEVVIKGKTVIEGLAFMGCSEWKRIEIEIPEFLFQRALHMAVIILSR